MGTPINTGSVEEMAMFRSVFPEVLKTFLNVLTDSKNLKQRYAMLLKENLGLEKQDSGILVITAYKMYESPENVTSENLKLASILGWCANMLMATNSIRDDIMDSSELRYGNSCWYKKNDVGLQAINDSNLISDGLHLLLKHYFSEVSCYLHIIEWFHEVAVKIEIGHSLDHECSGNGTPKLELFTMPTYKNMIKYKTTYPLYLLPITLGKFLAGKFNYKLSIEAETIISELGLFLNAQNDILDCYGDLETTGKNSNDIREGKCTWLVVKALQRATSTQKEILNEHYGKPKHESEQKIRILFKELDILQEFLFYEQDSFNVIRRMIQLMPEDANRDFMNKIMFAAYKTLQ